MIDKEKVKARNRRCYLKNKEKRLQRQKEYNDARKDSPEQKAKNIERSKVYYAKTKNDPDRKAVRKACSKSWYLLNKDRILEERKEWRLTMLGTLEYRFKRAIQTSKQRGIAFSLTYEEFVQTVEQPCYYCNYKLCNPVVEGSGIDRIDSSKGYEIGNVISCGHRCNLLKNQDLTMEEAKAAIEAILKIRLVKEYELRRSKERVP